MYGGITCCVSEMSRVEGIRRGSASLGSCTTSKMLAGREVKIRYSQSAAEFKMDSNAVKKSVATSAHGERPASLANREHDKM